MPVKYGLGDAVDYEDSNGSIHRLFVYGILLDGKYLLSRSVHRQPDCESWIPGSRLKAVPDSACETSVATLASLASDYKDFDEIRSEATELVFHHLVLATTYRNGSITGAPGPEGGIGTDVGHTTRKNNRSTVVKWQCRMQAVKMRSSLCRLLSSLAPSRGGFSTPRARF